MNYGSRAIDEVLTFTAHAHNYATGEAVSADSAPTYRVYEDASDTPVLTGTMSHFDSTNTDGLYRGQITCSAAIFEVGKTYTIYIATIVDGVQTTTSHTFQMAAPVRLSGAQSIPSLSVINTAGDAITLTAISGKCISASSLGEAAITVTSVGGNNHALVCIGAGSGSGIAAIGGNAGGHGLYLDGDDTGDDLYLAGGDAPTLLVGLTDGAITADKIASGAFTNAKFAAGAFSSTVFAAGAIDDNAWGVTPLDFGTLMDSQGYTEERGEALGNILRASRAIIEGTCDSDATATVITWSTINTTTVAANEFRGLILKFPIDTPTAELRGQAAEIISNTTTEITVSPAFTVDPGPTDIFVIE